MVQRVRGEVLNYSNVTAAYPATDIWSLRRDVVLKDPEVVSSKDSSSTTTTTPTSQIPELSIERSTLKRAMRRGRKLQPRPGVEEMGGRGGEAREGGDVGG